MDIVDASETRPMDGRESPLVDRRQAFAGLAILTGILAASALLPLPGTDGRIAQLPSICPFYETTGLPCPACGLTRVFVCMSHGRFADAIHWHPLGPAIFALAILLWAYFAVLAARGRPPFQLTPRIRARLVWTGGGIFVAVGVVRAVMVAGGFMRF